MYIFNIKHQLNQYSANSKEEMKGEFLPGKTAMKLSVAYGTIDPNAPQKPAMKFTTQTIKGELLLIFLLNFVDHQFNFWFQLNLRFSGGGFS